MKERNEVFYFIYSAGLVFVAFAVLTVPLGMRKRCPSLDYRLLISGLFSIGIGVLKEICDVISSTRCQDENDDPTTFCQGFSMWDLLVNVNGASMAVFVLILCDLVCEESGGTDRVPPPTGDSTVASTVVNEDINEFDNQQQQLESNECDVERGDCYSTGIDSDEHGTSFATKEQHLVICVPAAAAAANCKKKPEQESVQPSRAEKTCEGTIKQQYPGDQEYQSTPAAPRKN